MKAIICGLGSIGKVYADQLAMQGIESLAIVDPFEGARNLAENRGYDAYSRIDDVDGTYDYAVVANWGPEHVGTANTLIRRLGVRRLTVEKPFCTDLKSGNELLNIIKEKEILCNVHFRWAYIGLMEKIRIFEDEMQTGRIERIRVNGGACCLSTGGTHWMDFARRILQSECKFVSADLGYDQINPRAGNLVYVDGCARFTMDDGRSLSFDLCNRTSAWQEAWIEYRNHCVKIDGKSEISFYARSTQDVEKYGDKITRCGEMMLIKKNGDLVGCSTVKDVIQEALGTGFDDVYRKGNKLTCSASDGFKTSEMLIGALDASSKGQRLEISELDWKRARQYMIS